MNKSERWEFLCPAGVWPAFALVLVMAFASGVWAADTVRITHGPILGRLSAEGIGVWARTSRPGEFRVRYGLKPDALDQVSETVSTTSGRDNTGWIHVTGLQPRAKYYYRVETPAGPADRTPGGSFRTLPSAGQTRHDEHNPKGLFNFRFEFACGNRPQFNAEGMPPRPTYVTMLRELKDEIDFAIVNGDWIYEVKRDFPVSEWLEQVGQSPQDIPSSVRLTPAVVGIWENYKYYLETDPALATWHREIPSFFTFDDHEILNDINATALALAISAGRATCWGISAEEHGCLTIASCK